MRRTEPKPEAQDKPQPEAKAEPKTDAKPEATSEVKTEPKPGTEAKPPTDVSPQLVERVHKLYEELGRQDVRAVEDLENAQRESGKDESRK